MVKALWIMLRVHWGQKDKSGKPYILHPLHVALRCRGRNERIVALLHDVIEDGDMTIPELRAEGFSQEVLDAVDALTHRKYVDYMTYIERVKENPIARAVKIKDLEHNMDIRRLKKITDDDIKRLRKYLRAYEILN
ncbi:MAG: HD domain-containing protein [Clostridiales bacterium]|nr:HD domain-containing protein [Clostridiales bacterium]